MAELLRRRANARPERTALRFWKDGAWAAWSWGVLYERAERVAAGLAAAGIHAGENVLVVTPEVDLTVASLFGTWLLGAVPVLVGLPFRLIDPRSFFDSLRVTAWRLDARALVTNRTCADFAPGDGAIPVLAGEDLVASDPAGFRIERVRASAPALIQLTSGSTGVPRGVVLAHDRLLEHMACMSAALPSHVQSVAVSWLPLHHDMGLMGGLLFPLYNDFVGHMLSPADFRRRPMLWLEAMSEQRATICAAPPSAYALVLRLAQRTAEAGLRLDAWECAMVGAEPISADLLRRFAQAFAPVGFRPQAFFPVYGLAEATVAVTFPRLLERTRIDVIDRARFERHGLAVPYAEGTGALELVGVGSPIPRTELRVIGDDGCPQPDRRVGEIIVRAPTVMLRYFDDPGATGEALRGGWLRTGDLGYLDSGTLFVTGRKKDLIIRAGHNLIPSVIEEVVATVAGVRGGGVAAVGVRALHDETERCHVVAETKFPAEQYPQLARDIRAALESRAIPIDALVFVRPGTLPKTSSGKIRRRAVAEALATGRALEAA
jgi:acyl-CoA synthetase (AMP-forming)/AMP-acid ligase II